MLMQSSVSLYSCDPSLTHPGPDDGVSGEICKVTSGVAGVGLHQPGPRARPPVSLNVPVNTFLKKGLIKFVYNDVFSECFVRISTSG